MKKFFLSLVFLTLLIGPIVAHDPVTGPNEGMVVDASADHVELVALPKNPKGAIQLNQPDGKTAQARFN